MAGDYNSTDGIIEKLRATDNPESAAMLERIRERVREKDTEPGHYLEYPPEDAGDKEWFSTLMTLFGAALEREYPAEVAD